MLNDDPTARARMECPKCHAPMRSYERNRVMIDRCTECGGLFLDRGELERLVDAEAVHYDPRGADARGGRGGYRDDERRDWRDDRRDYRARDWDDDDDRRDRRGRRGFLEDLFDFD